jgi:hypothetical protein
MPKADATGMAPKKSAFRPPAETLSPEGFGFRAAVAARALPPAGWSAVTPGAEWE